jgi:hypothetical protein
VVREVVDGNMRSVNLAQPHVGRNELCPCGSGDKYNVCCEGNIDWPSILSGVASDDVYVRSLSVRGKNLKFLDFVGSLFQLDRFDKGIPWPAIKKACTPKIVQQIHYMISKLWPDKEDLVHCLEREKRGASGLYVGTYNPEAILRGITRHSLYDESILLVDPFPYVMGVSPELNPLQYPEKYVSNTLMNLWLWIKLQPWIAANIIKFVRTPSDFDYQLFCQSIDVEEKRYQTEPELLALRAQLLDETKNSEVFEQYRQFLFLRVPDSSLRRQIKEMHPHFDVAKVEEYLQGCRRLRDAHPYCTALPEPNGESPKSWSEFIITTTGTNHEVAKVMCALTGSHLVTDSAIRWKEIELDRKHNDLSGDDWEPVAKAFQATEFKFLNNVSLDSALQVRKDERLRDVRQFLRKLWHQSRSDNVMSNANAKLLAEELTDTMRHAEEEWRRIQVSGLATLGREIVASITQTIVSGNILWLGALGCSAAINAGRIRRKEALYANQNYPAAYFARLKRENG